MWTEFEDDNARLRKILDELEKYIRRMDKKILNRVGDRKISCLDIGGYVRDKLIDNRLRSWIHLKWGLEELLWKLERRALDEGGEYKNEG